MIALPRQVRLVFYNYLICGTNQNYGSLHIILGALNSNAAEY